MGNSLATELAMLGTEQLLNPQQQQVLWAIDGYVTALQQGKESEVVDKRFREEPELPQDETEPTVKVLEID